MPESLFFIKKETLTQVFSCEFCEISKNTFSTQHLQTTASAVKMNGRKKYFFPILILGMFALNC